ncbi:MAG: alginate export family protein [Nitrospirota bacterium]
MKKYLAIVLGVLFILSFAVTAFAEVQVTLGGKILVRGWYFDNVGTLTVNDVYVVPPAPTTTTTYSNLPIDNTTITNTHIFNTTTTTSITDETGSSSQALYTTNAYLTIDAKVSDNVRGFMELETTTGGNGNANTGLFYWGRYDTKPASDLFFRQLWIQYTGSGLLGVPSGLQVGHMPVTLGEKQFLNNERFGNDMILLWVDPAKELHLAAASVKVNEGDTSLGSIKSWDDLDLYALIATYSIDKNNTIGANWTWIHSDGFVPSIGGSVPNVDKVNFHNIGVHGNGKVAGLSYAAEADFQFGKAKDVLFSGSDAKFGGYGLYAKLGYALDPVTIRGSLAYGSGDDDFTDEDVDEFQTLMGPDEIGPLARWVHYTQIYERTIRTTAQEALLTSTSGGNTRNTGIANTTYYNLGLDVNPVKELTLSLDGFLIYASENESNDGSKTAGQELDFKGTYQIAKNLSYFLEAAAFWPGNYYEDTFGIDKKTVTQIVHGICLTF